MANQSTMPNIKPAGLATRHGQRARLRIHQIRAMRPAGVKSANVAAGIACADKSAAPFSKLYRGEQTIVTNELNTPATLAVRHYSKTKWYEERPGLRFRVLASSAETNGTYSLLETVAQKGVGTPMHIHDKEDEHFVILEGTIHIVAGDKTMDVGAGQSASLPRGVRHAWINNSETPVHILVTFSPAGFEDLCVDMAERIKFDLSEIAEKYGVRMVGPGL
jgi:mannose-6-phosphate isomerase-like protein (cupin superfamily)